MEKLKAIWRLIWAKHTVCLTRRKEAHSSILYSDRYKYPSVAPAHLYADLLFNNTHAVIRWLRCRADTLEKRLNNPDNIENN